MGFFETCQYAHWATFLHLHRAEWHPKMELDGCLGGLCKHQWALLGLHLARATCMQPSATKKTETLPGTPDSLCPARLQTGLYGDIRRYTATSSRVIPACRCRFKPACRYLVCSRILQMRLSGTRSVVDLCSGGTGRLSSVSDPVERIASAGRAASFRQSICSCTNSTCWASNHMSQETHLPQPHLATPTQNLECTWLFHQISHIVASRTSDLRGATAIPKSWFLNWN